MQANAGDDVVDGHVLEAVPRLGAAVATVRRVLVVEDYVDLADTTRLLLEQVGHEVVTAYDGWSALEAVRTFRPEVVLLDLGLPGIDGFSLADALRRSSNARHALLVAVTGWRRPLDRARIHEHGFATHFMKPYEMSAVLDVIAAAPRLADADAGATAATR